MKNPRILCVDDDEVGLKVRKLTLESRGYAVATAANADAALQLSNDHFDLYILDYAMPGMNGGELAMLIRHKHPHAKIVLLSAYLSVAPEHMRSADAFLTKSGDPLHFLSNVGELLQQSCAN